MSRKGDGKRKPALGAKPGGKQPASGVPQYGSKRPVLTPETGQRLALMRFRFDRVDLGGPWCLSKITPEHHQLLIKKLAEFETMTINQVFHERTGDSSLGTDYTDMSQCPNRDTIRRLKELELDAIDGLSRLALGGKPRLYGIRHQHEFSILWWDPLHEVWPSKLKHT